MGHNQFSLLRQVIQGQGAETLPDQRPQESGSTPGSGPASGQKVFPPGIQPKQGEAPTVSVRPPFAAPTPRAGSPAHSGHMKLLFDNAPVALAMFDTEMRYLLANRRWLEDFRLTNVDTAGRSQYELFPSLHPGWRHVYNRALAGQVVRSDRDAITQDGKPVVYRWEVRPWRHMDTTIGGVTISCEKLGTDAAGRPGGGDTRDDDAISLWKTSLPLLAVTRHGRILQVSEALKGCVPELSDEDDPVFFWDVLGDAGQQASLRRQTLLALDAVLTEGAVQASIFTTPVVEDEESTLPAAPVQWLVSRLTEGVAGSTEEAALIIGVQPASAEAEGGAGSVEVQRLSAELAGLQQSQRESAEAEALSRQREARLRAVLELAPCGLMVINEHASPIYQNAQVTAILGRACGEGVPMHQWLAEGARDEQHRAEVVRLWSEEVWRKRRAIPMPLTGSDGLHREVEMRPVPLPGGGLLLMLQDVTESRRAEEMLRSTEAKFRALVHENPLPVVLTDRSGAVFDANPACELLLGRTRAEMRRMPVENWLDEDSLARRATALQELAKRGERHLEISVRVLHAEDYSFGVQLRLAIVPDVSGQPMFTLHFFSPVDRPSPVARPSHAPFSESGKPGPDLELEPEPEAELESRLEPSPEEEAPARAELEPPPAITPSPEEEAVPMETLEAAVPSTAAIEPPAESGMDPYAGAEEPPEAEAEAPSEAGEGTALIVQPVMLLTTDVHGRISAWTGEAEGRFGYTEAEAAGRSLHTLFRPSDATGFAGEIGALREAARHDVLWTYYHRNAGRQEGAFTVQPSEDGALSLVLLEQRMVEARRTEAASADEPAALEEEPPPPFLDEMELPEELPIVPALLLEDPQPPAPGALEPEAGLLQEVAQEPASPDDAATAPLAPAPARPTTQELQRERLLLGETHHRVKNHLQIITSMLNLQMSTLHNEEARDALRSSQNRVRSIAALHQHLYLLTSGETADFHAFATGLIKHLRECYHVTDERVPLDLTIPGKALPEEWLMPLALALNEMVSNAFKHAFPDDRAGFMTVSLSWDDREGRLCVADDGTGLPEDFTQQDHPGMGLKILRVFAGQLGGEVRTSPGDVNGAGVSFELVFPMPKPVESVTTGPA